MLSWNFIYITKDCNKISSPALAFSLLPFDKVKKEIIIDDSDAGITFSKDASRLFSKSFVDDAKRKQRDLNCSK